MILPEMTRWSFFIVGYLTLSNSFTEAFNKGRMNYQGSQIQNQSPNLNQNPLEFVLQHFMFPELPDFSFMDAKPQIQPKQDTPPLNPLNNLNSFQNPSKNPSDKVSIGWPQQQPLENAPEKNRNQELILNFPEENQRITANNWLVANAAEKNPEDNEIKVDDDEGKKKQENFNPFFNVNQQTNGKRQVDVTIDFEVERIPVPEEVKTSQPMQDGSLKVTLIPTTTPKPITTTTTTRSSRFTKRRGSMPSLFDIIFPMHRERERAMLMSRRFNRLKSMKKPDFEVPVLSYTEVQKNPKFLTLTKDQKESKDLDSKCNGVRCSPPPSDANCVQQKSQLDVKSFFDGEQKEWSPFSQVSDCCPIWMCHQQDGSFNVHYGLIGASKRVEESDLQNPMTKKESSSTIELVGKSFTKNALKKVDLEKSTSLSLLDLMDSIPKDISNQRVFHESKSFSVPPPFPSSPPKDLFSHSPPKEKELFRFPRFHDHHKHQHIIQMDLQDNDPSMSDLFPLNFNSKAPLPIFQNANSNNLIRMPTVIAISSSSSPGFKFPFPLLDFNRGRKFNGGRGAFGPPPFVNF